MLTNPTLKPYERQLNKWLPGVRLQHTTEPPADVILHWDGPQQPVTYVVEHKANLEHQDVWAVVQQLKRYRDALGPHPPARLLVVAPFIRRRQGTFFEQHGIDYIDLAGNAHLEAPGVFVHVEGVRPTGKVPRPPLGTTRGWVKTVMALLVRPELILQPYRPIAGAADVAPATVMHCLADLKAAGFVRRERGKRHIVNTGDLLALWTQAYVGVLRPRLIQRNFQMRVVDKPERWRQLTDVLGKHNVHWALTGVDAALLTNPHLRAEQTELYAAPEQFEDPALLRQLQIQPAIGGNLQVIEPPGPIALEHERDLTGIPVAPVLLAYAELRYRNNDQANEAAELLVPRVLNRVEA